MDIKPEMLEKVLMNHKNETITVKLIEIIKHEAINEEIKDFEAWMKTRGD